MMCKIMKRETQAIAINFSLSRSRLRTGAAMREKERLGHRGCDAPRLRGVPGVPIRHGRARPTSEAIGNRLEKSPFLWVSKL